MKLALLVLIVGISSQLPAQRLDPDYCWTCADSRQHFASGVVIDGGFHALFPQTTIWERLGFNLVVGGVWEAGQADVARTAHLQGPGFGFGLKDLALDMAGALVGEGLWAVGRKIL